MITYDDYKLACPEEAREHDDGSRDDALYDAMRDEMAMCWRKPCGSQDCNEFGPAYCPGRDREGT